MDAQVFLLGLLCGRDQFAQNLRLLGGVVDRPERLEAVCASGEASDDLGVFLAQLDDLARELSESGLPGALETGDERDFVLFNKFFEFLARIAHNLITHLLLSRQVEQNRIFGARQAHVLARRRPQTRQRPSARQNLITDQSVPTPSNARSRDLAEWRQVLGRPDCLGPRVIQRPAEVLSLNDGSVDVLNELGDLGGLDCAGRELVVHQVRLERPECAVRGRRDQHLHSCHAVHLLEDLEQVKRVPRLQLHALRLHLKMGRNASRSLAEKRDSTHSTPMKLGIAADQ